MTSSSTSLLIVALFALAATTSAMGSFRADSAELHSLWSSWKTLHSKTYTLAEDSARFAIFVDNYRKIVSFNSQSDSDVRLALNRFGDLTSQEFKSMYASGYKSNAARSSHRQQQNSLSSHVDFSVLPLADSVDWRTKGAVGPVKNQQQCGSCWAFSTTAALESLYFITSGKLLSFSEQQIVDCDTQDDGCNGGLPEQAFDYTAEAGIETEQDYPYNAKDGKCKYQSDKAIHVNSGSKSITAKSTPALKAALVQQPVSIGIEADEQAFQFYSSGVIKKNCGDDLDHAVLAVGYQVVGLVEAFIVKNSWGSSWGEEGYVYISTDGNANNGNGVCGILGDPVVPTA